MSLDAPHCLVALDTETCDACRGPIATFSSGIGNTKAWALRRGTILGSRCGTTFGPRKTPIWAHVNTLLLAEPHSFPAVNMDWLQATHDKWMGAGEGPAYTELHAAVAGKKGGTGPGRWGVRGDLARDGYAALVEALHRVGHMVTSKAFTKDAPLLVLMTHLLKAVSEQKPTAATLVDTLVCFHALLSMEFMRDMAVFSRGAHDCWGCPEQLSVALQRLQFGVPLANDMTSEAQLALGLVVGIVSNVAAATLLHGKGLTRNRCISVAQYKTLISPTQGSSCPMLDAVVDKGVLQELVRGTAPLRKALQAWAATIPRTHSSLGRSVFASVQKMLAELATITSLVTECTKAAEFSALAVLVCSMWWRMAMCAIEHSILP